MKQELSGSADVIDLLLTSIETHETRGDSEDSLAIVKSASDLVNLLLIGGASDVTTSPSV